jgi:hypothetical protein
VQQPPPKKPSRRITDDDDAGPKKKKPKKKASIEPPPPPRSLDPAQRVCASRVLAVHGEEEAFLEAVRAAPRGRHLWLGYDPKPPVDAKSLDAFLRARPHRTVFKFRGEDAPSFGLGTLGAELEHAARRDGGAAAMQILRDKSQMSTLFAPTGAGDTDWNHSKTSIEVSFDGFIRSADKADQCRSRRDVKGLDREVEKGSNAQKVTEWKPAFLRRQGTSPESTGLLPPWFESRSWLTKLKRSDAEVFRPKFALMQAGACTEHHRDNYGTLTWIKVLGGSQLLATWNMADGDVLTRRLFPNFSELQVRVDGVFMKPRSLDAVDVAIRESTRLAREPRPRRDAVVRHRLLRSSRTTRRSMTKSFLGLLLRNYLLHD